MIPVLHVITSLEVGGAQHMLVKLCERLDRGRFTPVVVSLLAGGALEADLRTLDVPVLSLGMRAGSADPRAIRRLVKIVRRVQPAVVQSWLYHADLVATAALRFAPGPRLAWNVRCTHAPEAGGGLAARVAPRLCAWASRRPDVIVTNSAAGRSSHETLGYRPRAWRLIPNGFDLERLRPDPGAGTSLRDELGLGPQHLLIGMLARWHPMKQHHVVLNLARELAGRLPELRFVLAGTDVERGAPGYEAAFEAAGSPSSVIALGVRRDVPRLAAGYDALVSASGYFEGFPNALGEALACGTPCVTTDVGDSADVVGDAGFVVPPGDRAALAARVAELAAMTEQQRRALGARGRQRMAERFELGRVVRMYEELWLELTEALPCAV